MWKEGGMVKQVLAKTNFFHQTFENKKREKGMTLIEILIVIALISTVMAVLATNLTKTGDEGMRGTARLGMGKIQQALQLYRLHNHAFPTTDQGLQALLTDPGNAKGWRGPYIDNGDEGITDPWGNKYQYESDGKAFKIISAGPDQQFGTDDDVTYPETKNTTGSGGTN